jgi:archaeal flagellin FlaB
MKNERSDCNAFTGLEAAIILVTFIVVATVFSFEILASGYSTTQKSQEVIYNGIGQASSALMEAGGVYGISNSGGTIDMVNFTLGVSAGGNLVDFDKVVVAYSNSTHLETLTPVSGRVSTVTTPGTWAVIDRRNEIGASNNLLERGEFFTISVHPSHGIAPNDRFTIELRPTGGAAISIQRTAPSTIRTINPLD